MAVGKLLIQVDAGRVSAQLAALEWLLPLLPDRVSRRFRQKAHRLVGGAVAKLADRSRRAARTSDGVIVGRIRVEVGGLDELIAAAARRAARLVRAKRNRVHGSFLSNS